MIPKLKPGNIVELVVDDLTTQDEWFSAAEAASATPVQIRIAGIYINHDKRVLRLALGIVPEDGSAMVLTMIPLGTIRHIKKVL